MKNIQLCGFGNGLVDLQFEVSDQIIDELELKKGQMILVDAEKQNSILDLLKDHKGNKCSGGSAANSIIAFSKFGGKAAYMSSLGNDELGNFYANEFKELGIELKAVVHDGQSTGTSVVMITPDSERTMHTSLAASDNFSADNIDRDIVVNSEWLYLEGYKFSSPEGTSACEKAMEYALEAGTKIALTFSDVFIIDLFKDKLDKVLANTDLVFCNEAEAMAYTGKPDAEEAFNELSSKFENVAMTLGSKGSRIKWGSEVISIKPFETKAVDTTGAGDMYAGGFFYGLLETGSPEKAGLLGSLAASRVVSQLGARLNEDHRELYRKIMNI